MSIYTSENYISKQELSIVNKHNKFHNIPDNIVNKIKEIVHWTTDYQEIKYCLKNNILSAPKCEFCSSINIKFMKSSWSYAKSCSKTCASNLRVQKTKSTMMENYGDANYNNRDKCEESCIVKYGVRHVMQVVDIHNSAQKHRWYTIISPTNNTVLVQGYERYVIPKLWDLHGESNLIVKRQDMPKIFYIGEDTKSHRYYPDGLLFNNTVVEIKSTWTLRYLYKNLKPKLNAIHELNLQFMLIIYDVKSDKLIIAESLEEIYKCFVTFTPDLINNSIPPELL